MDGQLPDESSLITTKENVDSLIGESRITSMWWGIEQWITVSVDTLEDE